MNGPVFVTRARMAKNNSPREHECANTKTHDVEVSKSLFLTFSWCYVGVDTDQFGMIDS